MPYVITTRFDGAKHAHPTTPERPNPRAVATLDEMESVVREMIRATDLEGEPFGVLVEQFVQMPEQGGTVGPLPDGTVIEVERVPLETIHKNTGPLPPNPDVSAETLIRAYNAQQA